MSTMADTVRARLEAAWENKVPDKDMRPQPRYAAYVAQELTSFIEFSEKVFRVLAGKIKSQEIELSELRQAAGLAPSTPAMPTNGSGNGAQIARNGHTSADMVRVDALGEPLSAEDQAKEEAADLQFEGKIDTQRYVSRASLENRPPPGPPPIAEGEVVPQVEQPQQQQAAPPVPKPSPRAQG